MSTEEQSGLSAEELAAEGATGLPDKEVVSLLDLNADLDLDLAVAAPIDLAVAANANVAAPIDAAVAANALSSGSTAQALADQGVIIDQGINAEGRIGGTRVRRGLGRLAAAGGSGASGRQSVAPPTWYLASTRPSTVPPTPSTAIY